MSTPLSVIIPTRNEAANIQACIQSVGDLAQEIVVVDNFSEDATTQIAESMSARVFQRKFDNFSANKNAAIEKAVADWVLLLDADERLTPALRSEIATTIATPETSANAFRIRRETFFKTRRVRCWSSSSVVRLFRRNKARYNSAKLVHEELLVDGSVDSLIHPIEHYTFRSFDQYLPKVHSFTTLAAIEAHQNGKRTGWASLAFLPPLRFLRTYLLKGGILDGVPGLIISSLAAYTIYLKHSKLWELQNTQPR